jgi:hypothetical protein
MGDKLIVGRYYWGCPISNSEIAPAQATLHPVAFTPIG